MNAPAAGVADRRAAIDHLQTLISSPRVRDGALQERDQSLRVQACVIGSGAGGATVACELARRGHSVVLLEEGAYRTGRDLGGDPAEMVKLLYRNRGLTGTIGRLAVPIPLGRCVGGTTTIGAGSCARASGAVLSSWERDHGVTGVGPEELASYYERAERDLGVSPVPDETFGRSGALLETAARELGWDGERLQRGVRGCLGTGVCSFGCPQDAKQAMHLTYVPAALVAGALLYTRTRAEKLLLSDGRVFGVQARFLDAQDRPSAHGLRVVADRVVVACGALLTPAFLERSGVGRSSGQLGRNLRIHPTAHVAARFADEVRGWEGVPQGYALRQFADEGILLQTQFLPPALEAPGLPGVGMAHKEILASYPYLASVAASIADESTGTVRAGRNGFPLVRYRMEDGDRRRLLRAMALAAEALFAAGAIEVYSGIHSRPVLKSREEAVALAGSEVRATDVEMTAFHPMGTARMADDAKRGVVDASGQVHDARDLYVADASLFPASCRTGPQMTIVALALRIAEQVSEGLGAPL